MKYQVEIQGMEPVQRMLSLLLDRGAKLKPFMRQAGEIMRGSVTRNFEDEGRPSRWKPLSSLTRDIYAGLALDTFYETAGYKNLKRTSTRSRHQSAYLDRVVGGRKLLQGTGDLKKSIVLGDISDHAVEVGSSLPYARIHQVGGTIVPRRKNALLIPVGGGYFLRLRKVTIPARPYLSLQEEDQRTIMRALDAFMLGGQSNGHSG